MAKKSFGKHSKAAAEKNQADQQPQTAQVAAPLKVEVGSAKSNSAKKKKGEKPRGSHHGLKVFLIVLACLVGTYALVAVVFMFVFMPNTTLNGSDVSLKTLSSVSSSLSEDLTDYKATVSGDGISTTIKASDVDLSFDSDAFVKSALAQVNSWAWPYELTQQHQIALREDATFNENKLESLLSPSIEAVNQTATQPQNATIGYDETTSAFAVVPEVLGTAIDADALYATVGEGLASLEKTITLGDESLSLPSVTKDDPSLATAATTASAYLSVTLTLTLNGSTAATVGPDQIKDWVTIADDLTSTLDVDKVREWTEGDLSSQLDTVGTTRTYTRPDGKVITVSGGTYGWSIDGDSLATLIVDNITSNTSGDIEIPVFSSAAVVPTTTGGQDWGARYIDVDISEQYVRMYDSSGTVIWETSCVTGTRTDGRDTPQGVYVINAKRRNETLTGEIDTTTNQPSYTSQVSYWMPFVGNLVGLHDASWRSSFGGSIYLTNGSHGCVNLPSSAAAELYDLAQVGDVVVTHS